MSIGEQIKKARTEQNLTQVRLAESVGCTEQALIKWEKDVHTPLDIYQRKLEEILGIYLKEVENEETGKN